MRRYLIISFIVFLPFQFAWGAAARYCVHEKGEPAPVGGTEKTY